MPTTFREFVPTLFVKTTDYSYHIWRTLYNNGSYTMMAKLIRALELYYPMIQFLIKEDIPRGAI